MRFIVIVKASSDSEAGKPPEPALLATMAAYHEQLAQAGALLDRSGLQPSSQGWRMRWHAGRSTLVHGPFADGTGLAAGYTVIDVPSREAALEWTRRFPAPYGALADGEIEVRQLHEPDAFHAAGQA